MAITPQQKTALRNTLVDADFSELPNYQRGKVRDSFVLGDGRRIIVSTDRQSAFDQILASVPFKGQVLNQTAQFWFNALADICDSHVLEYIDPNIVIVSDLEMLPIEIVVRDYLTGSTNTSIWTMYREGARDVYGYRLPDGLSKNEKLPKTLLTPTTKGENGEHDIPLTKKEIFERALITPRQWDELEVMAFALFDRGKKIALKNNLILVDTKYEFGLTRGGRIALADEVHTPDSSRYWDSRTYFSRFLQGSEPVSLDKEFLRLWIYQRCDPYNEKIPEIPEEVLIEFSEKYISLFETVTGKNFKKPDINISVRDRVKQSLKNSFPQYF
mgnify:FL=1